MPDPARRESFGHGTPAPWDPAAGGKPRACRAADHDRRRAVFAWITDLSVLAPPRVRLSSIGWPAPIMMANSLEGQPFPLCLTRATSAKPTIDLESTISLSGRLVTQHPRAWR